MDARLKNEVKNLQKIGLPEEYALLSAGIKLGNEDVVNTILNDICDEQKELKEMLSYLVPFAKQESQSTINTTKDNLFSIVNPITENVSPYIVKE